MEINYSDNHKESTVLSLDEAHDIIHLKGFKTGATYLSISLPFNVNKIEAKYRDVNSVFEDVILFKNNYFSQFDICEVRMTPTEAAGRKRIGLLFRLSILFDEDAGYLYKDDKYLQTSILRSLIIILNDLASLKMPEIKFSRDNDFTLADLIDEDLIVGVFPHDWNADLSKPYLTQLFLNLYVFGFYLIDKREDTLFIPQDNPFQKKKFNELIYHKSSLRKYIDIAIVAELVKQNKYCELYLTELIKQSENEISRFQQIYGLIEIFKDEVLKNEIRDKLCVPDLAGVTGFKVHKDILDISNDSYCVDKLFNKYSNVDVGFSDDVFYEIAYFLEKCRNKSELDSKDTFPKIFYYLRNILVHDIQFLFIGNAVATAELRKELSRVVQKIEFLILDSLRASKF